MEIKSGATDITIGIITIKDYDENNNGTEPLT